MNRETNIMPSSLRTSGISKITFLFGIACGLMISYIVGYITDTSLVRTPGIDSYVRSLKGLKATDLDTHMREQIDKSVNQVRNGIFDDSHLHHDNSSAAKVLEKKVRVLCWIMTSPQNLDKKAIHVKKTWAKRCNVLLFFSSKTNNSFPTIGLDVAEGRQHLTGKTMQAFRYVYKHYRHLADWFMKADDDTYVILENLRYFLKDFKSTDPVYFGHRFKKYVKQGYYSGGAGYVISSEALSRLVRIGNKPSFCRQDGGSEDLEIGKCMERLGVKTVNTTDAMGRTRFHCFDPETHIYGGYPKWYYSYDANGGRNVSRIYNVYVENNGSFEGRDRKYHRIAARPMERPVILAIFLSRPSKLPLLFLSATSLRNINESLLDNISTIVIY